MKNLYREIYKKTLKDLENCLQNVNILVKSTKDDSLTIIGFKLNRLAHFEFSDTAKPQLTTYF